jgi:hypothetical protein
LDVIHGFAESNIFNSTYHLPVFSTRLDTSLYRRHFFLTGIEDPAGRPNYFFDDTELRESLGIDRRTATGSYCESLRLEQFNLQQVASVLGVYPEKVRNDIVLLANSSPKFYELISRGSLLYVVAELWERGGLSSYGANINSAAVMGLFIQSTYDRQLLKTGNFMVLNTSERSYFMSAVDDRRQTRERSGRLTRSKNALTLKTNLSSHVVRTITMTVTLKPKTEITGAEEHPPQGGH